MKKPWSLKLPGKRVLNVSLDREEPVRKPLIGLTPLVDKAGNLMIKPDYMEAIAWAGGIGVMLPLTGDEEALEQLIRQLDGFLFTGGHDLDPAYYGQEKKQTCGRITPERDSMELALFRRALELDKPILGICRGIQLMNIALGGTLYQDIPTEIPSEVPHRVLEKPLARDVHEIQVEPECPFRDLPLRLWVNSRHHQAIETLAPGLKVRARALDGVIEAVYMPEKPHVRAVQWHPENLRNELSAVIFEEFLKDCREFV